MFSGLGDPSRWILPAVLTEMAQEQPDLPWLMDSAGETMTFAQAESQSRKAAAKFAGMGVARGDRVGIFMSNGCDFVRAWLGLGKLGAVAVMFNTELRGPFLRHQLVDSGIAYLLTEANLCPVLADLAQEVLALTSVLVAGQLPVSHPDCWKIARWRDDAQGAEWDGPLPEAADIACIMYTSGTTGPSKGVLMPHAHCALYGIGSIRCTGLTSSDRYYISLPLFHANGLFIQLGATLLAGIPAFLRTRFSASNWLADVRAHRVTVTNLLGATASFILAQEASADDRDHALRAIVTSPNLPEHEAGFRQRFGVADVLSGFGMTESNIPIWGRIGWSVPGAAGWTHDDHFTVIIADPDNDRPVPPGQLGEILVRPKVPFGFMAGYLNAPEKTVEAWRNLWFHTGDAGFMGADGLVTFVDRIKDCIRRRGENISATEVETVILGLPEVAEVAAFAVPSDVPGLEDEIMLALVPTPGATIDCDKLVDSASRQLPRFACPRYIRIMDYLPKTATGKIQRAVLRREGVAEARDMLVQT